MSRFSLWRFQNLSLLREIDRDSLLTLLNPHRAFFLSRGLMLPDPAATRRPNDLDYEALAAVLLKPDFDTPSALGDALFYIHDMCTKDGMDALLDAFESEQIGLTYLQYTAADVAVRAWLTDQRRFEEVHAEQSLSLPRRFEYVRARDICPLFQTPTESKLKALTAALDEIYARKGRGQGLKVFMYEKGHTYLFVVRHGDPFVREGTLVRGKTSSVMYRPLRFDAVIYDKRHATLRLHAASAWERATYRQQFGLHVFGHIDHFKDPACYTLTPIRKQRAKCLTCRDIDGLKAVKLTFVRWNWEGGESVSHRAPNVFEAFRRRKVPIPFKARLSRATFAFKFTDARGHFSVTLEPPDVAHFTRDEDEPIVERWLTARGFILAPRGSKTGAGRSGEKPE